MCLSASLLALREQPADSYPTVFSSSRIDTLADGKIVINLDLAGEHRGLLTLNLEPDATGILGGTWVLAERYTDNTDPATGLEPPSHEGQETSTEHEVKAAEGVDAEHPHRDYVHYVDNGTISGTISSAALDFNSVGTLVDFRAQLAIANGSLTFDGISGSGLAELTRGLLLTTTGGVR
jgi:hypothetical protein